MSLDAIVLDALRSGTGPSAAAFALLAIGLNVHFGYTGLLNFGQVGFMLVGAYGVAIAVSTFGLSMWVGLVVSLVLAIVLALLLGVPTLRLRADYLAITTIAAAEILRLAFRSSNARDVTGGSFGLRGFAGEFYAVNPIPAGEYHLLEVPAGVVWLGLVAAFVALAVWLPLRLGRAVPWAGGYRPHVARAAALGLLVGVAVGYGLPLANPIPPGRYRLLLATVPDDRLWGLAVVGLGALALGGLAWVRHVRGGLPPGVRARRLGAAAGLLAGGLVARLFFAVNPLPAGEYGARLITYSERRVWVLLVAWGLVLFACLVTWRLMHSPWGRVLKSIREDEDAARSLGKNVFSYKMQSLVLGGVAGAAGGAVFALHLQTVNPDTFMPQYTFYAYTVLILGGAARVLGPVVGAVVFWFLFAGVDSLLRQATAEGFLPESLFGSGAIGAVRLALVGLGLMLLMIYRPQGLLGDLREMQLDVK